MTGDPAHSIEDVVLAERIASGDREALGILYDRYASMAMGTAFRVVGDQAQAEDVIHDAFVAAWQKISGFEPSRGTLRAWLMTIVRNRAIDRVRTVRPSVPVDVADRQSLLRTGGNPTWDEAVEHLSADQLRLALARLPEEQRTAVELAYFGGHTYREIAVITGVPHGTANGRLRLALAKLRDMLQRTDAAPIGVSSGSASLSEVDR